MHKLVTLAAIIFCISVISVAQEETTPRATIFGGYSYLRNGGSNNFNGWEGQGTFNFTRHFGITADINGNYRTLASFSLLPGVSVTANQSIYNFLFGPAVTTSFGRTSVFGHALFGQALSNLGGGISLPIIGGISSGVTSATAFAMAFGGGVDIGLSRHFAIRAAQLDYVRTNFSSADALSTGLFSNTNGRQNSFRYSAGIVFRF
ncbi:MAG TPA: outer membrane beta-barrel protein [Terriglobales bacterium]|nr:outer membrane beta-barrel protein [Terriglobales bacterium]